MAGKLRRLLGSGTFVLASLCARSEIPAPLPDLSGATRGVHDPSMIRQGSTWYVFGSGGRPDGPQLPVRCSQDRLHWTPCGHIFEQGIPGWIRAKLPGTRDLWAPDISFVNGEYRLYYAYSILGKNTSGIALVVNRTLDPASPLFGWVDHGSIVESRTGDDFNAIDPNFVRDEKGEDWLAFGSFWSGIKLRRLAPDGTLLQKDRHLYSLARRARPGGADDPPRGTPAAWQAIEAPYLVRHEGFFYLFTSWDHCCQGAASNYHIVVGRATAIKGPYVDEAGKKLLKGGGTEVLNGNQHWAGPGGESVWTNPDPHGDDLLVYHAYDTLTGRPFLQIAPIEWKAGWPVVHGAQ